MGWHRTLQNKGISDHLFENRLQVLLKSQNLLMTFAHFAYRVTVQIRPGMFQPDPVQRESSALLKKSPVVLVRHFAYVLILQCL